MMKKSFAASLAAISGTMLVLSAAPADAYPDAAQNLTVDRQVLPGGEQFTATATSNVLCDDWTLSWNGDTRTRTAQDFVTTYTAPKVDEITKIPLHGTCEYTVPVAQRSARTAERATWERTIMITVLPEGQAAPPNDDDGLLPDTGGPTLWLLLAGAGLAGAGWVVIRSTKRARA